MLRSMTGFGSVQGVVEGVEYAVETRSVNNRYLKAVIKVPESWANAEQEIEKLLRSKIYRGTVTLAVRMKIPDEQATYRVNTAALANYIEQLKPLEMDANPSIRIDLGSLLQLPGVCEAPEFKELCERTYDGLTALINQALDALLEMRLAEGQLLKKDLLDQCEIIDRSLLAVGTRAPQVIKEYHGRLATRVAELTASAKIEMDQDTLAREVAIYAEKCDIAEEIARLSGHVKHFRLAMASPEPAGRKLDFIAQEMLREANTIGSKANDVEIAHAVVDMKTAIDRIKEQVQNAE
ncbi:MAG: YicC family protein [Planctomycetaceae bacterium]|nr:MAG: YicC family protein [Planctomycetaceae bacterium]